MWVSNMQPSIATAPPAIAQWPYDLGMRKQPMPTLPMDTTLLKPGLRLAVGVSGGADSVALLRGLHARSGELGLVLHAAHLHHGLRGADADVDLEFVRALAAALELPFHEARWIRRQKQERPASPLRKRRGGCVTCGSANFFAQSRSI